LVLSIGRIRQIRRIRPILCSYSALRAPCSLLLPFLIKPAPEGELYVGHKPLGEKVGADLEQKRVIDMAQAQAGPDGGVVPEAVGFFFAAWPMPVSLLMTPVI
jgi:hypothetical protein